MRIRAKGFAGQLDISSPEVLGDAVTKVFRRSMVAGDVLDIPDEYYQFPNIKNAIDLGFLEILEFDSNPESHVINAELDEILAGLPGGGGGNGESLIETITQTAHGFVAGNVVYINSSGDYALAQSDDAATTDAVVGVVQSVVSGNVFRVVYGGVITGLSGLVPGTVYYLSDSTPGVLVAGEPTCPAISKPILVAKSSTEGVILNHRGTQEDKGTDAAGWMGL